MNGPGRREDRPFWTPSGRMLPQAFRSVNCRQPTRIRSAVTSATLANRRRSLTWIWAGASVVQSRTDEPNEIRQLVLEVGLAGGARPVSPEEVARLRDFFGHRVLRTEIDAYISMKHSRHVEDDEQWPADTTPGEYLESLRATVLDPSSGIYLTDATLIGEWAIYFSGRVRRAWRGRSGSDRIVVIFNGEHHRLVTGFQPRRGDSYVDRQGGFWVYQP